MFNVFRAHLSLPLELLCTPPSLPLKALGLPLELLCTPLSLPLQPLGLPFKLLCTPLSLPLEALGLPLKLLCTPPSLPLELLRTKPSHPLEVLSMHLAQLVPQGTHAQLQVPPPAVRAHGSSGGIAPSPAAADFHPVLVRDVVHILEGNERRNKSTFASTNHPNY